jgi:glycosidase
MNRFLFNCGYDKKKLKEAAKVQFSVDQPVIIYYGTEVGMAQEKSTLDFKEHGDLQARMPMIWEGQDMELLTFYKKLIRERKEASSFEND